jgi:hypothetical protein
MKPALEEGVDFYFNEQGYLVFTAKYLLNRGYCCGNGCRNCPYDYTNVPEPERIKLLKKREAANNQDINRPY